MNIFERVPLKGSRTILSVVLLVIVVVADIFGVGVDNVDADLSQAVKVIIAGLAGVFYRLK
jgi:hypothetical protein